MTVPNSVLRLVAEVSGWSLHCSFMNASVDDNFSILLFSWKVFAELYIFRAWRRWATSAIIIIIIIKAKRRLQDMQQAGGKMRHLQQEEMTYSLPDNYSGYISSSVAPTSGMVGNLTSKAVVDRRAARENSVLVRISSAIGVAVLYRSHPKVSLCRVDAVDTFDVGFSSCCSHRM